MSTTLFDPDIRIVSGFLISLQGFLKLVGHGFFQLKEPFLIQLGLKIVPKLLGFFGGCGGHNRDETVQPQGFQLPELFIVRISLPGYGIGEGENTALGSKLFVVKTGFDHYSPRGEYIEIGVISLG